MDAKEISSDGFGDILSIMIMQFGAPKIMIIDSHISFSFKEDDDGLSRTTAYDTL